MNFLIPLLLTLTAFNPEISTDRVSGKVTYVSNENVYIDLGRSDRVQPGDSGVIIRRGIKIADLRIIFSADNSSSCEVNTDVGSMMKGDSVLVIVERTEILVPTQIQLTVEDTVLLRKRRKTRDVKSDEITGYAGLDFFVQDGLGNSQNNYYQPSLRLKLKAKNIARSNYNLSLKMRGRKTIRDPENGNSDDEWNNRIYELSIFYDNPASAHSIKFGRITVNKIGGIGYIDGALASYKFSESNTGGVFVGTEPDYSTSGIRSNKVKLGAFSTFTNGVHPRRYNLTVALVGQYRDEEIDKEYFILQNDVTFGPDLSLYQSADVSINRGWKKNFNDDLVSFTRLMLSCRYSPLNWFTSKLSYNRHQNEPSNESKSLPDSLFSVSSRQGLRLSASVKLPKHYRISVSSSARTKQHVGKISHSEAIRLANSNMFNLGYRINLLFQTLSNSYSQGYRYSAGIGRYLAFGKTYLTISYGGDRLKYSSNDQEFNDQWLEIDGNLRVNSSTFASLSTNLLRGNSYEANNYYFNLGKRF